MPLAVLVLAAGGWWVSLQPPVELSSAWQELSMKANVDFFHLSGLLEGRFVAAVGSEFHRYSIPWYSLAEVTPFQ